MESLVQAIKHAECYQLILGEIGTNANFVRDVAMGYEEPNQTMSSDSLHAIDQVSTRIRELLQRAQE